MSIVQLPDNVTQIPTITELRRQINYGDDRKAEWSAVKTHIQRFREAYRTSAGTPGSTFANWKNPTHRANLRKMVHHYLDHGEGAQFWPNDKNALYYNGLHSLEHREPITLTLIQMFFLLNRKENPHVQQKQTKGTDKDRSLRGEDEQCPGASGSCSKSKPLGANDSSAPKDKSVAVNSSHNANPTFKDVLSALGGNSNGGGNQQAGAARSGPVPRKITITRKKPRKGRTSNAGPRKRTTASAKEQDEGSDWSEPRVSGRKRPREEPASSFPGRNPPRKRRIPNRRSYATNFEEIKEACSPEPSDAKSGVGTIQQRETVPNEQSPGIEHDLEQSLDVDAVVNQAQPHTPENAIVTNNPGLGTNSFDAPATRLRFGNPSPISRDGPSTTSKRIFEDIFGWKPGMRTPERSPPSSPGFRPVARDQVKDCFNTSKTHEVPVQLDLNMRNLERPRSALLAAPMNDVAAATPMAGSPEASEMSSHGAPERKDRPQDSHRSLETHGIFGANKEGGPSTPAEKMIHRHQSPSVTSGLSTPASIRQSIKYVLVHSYSPWWEAESWTPKRKFMRMTLSELMDELPPDFASMVRKAPGLMFRMIGAGSQEERPIAHGEGDAFDSMRDTMLKRAIANHRRRVAEKGKYKEGDVPPFLIEIQALGNDYIAEEGKLKKRVEDDAVYDF